jgi:hypothetical protein
MGGGVNVNILQLRLTNPTECTNFCDKTLPFTFFPRLQCCQMIYFQTKNPALGKFCLVSVLLGAILSILLQNGLFYGHLVHFVVI